jgi:hypothetical protein
MCYYFYQYYLGVKEMNKQFAEIEKMEAKYKADKAKKINEALDCPEIRKEIEELFKQLNKQNKIKPCEQNFF